MENILQPPIRGGRRLGTDHAGDGGKLYGGCYLMIFCTVKHSVIF